MSTSEPLSNMSSIISAAVAAKMTPEFIEDQVDKRVEKLVVEAVDGALRSYSDIGQLIKKSVEEALRVDRLDLPTRSASPAPSWIAKPPPARRKPPTRRTIPMPANLSTPEVTRAPVRIALEDVTPTIAAAFGDDLCLIWSGEWQAYWRAGGNGYTKDVAQAGWYTIQAAYARTCHCDPSKQIAFERPDATPARGGDELREEITQAIARADAAFGYAYRMTKMDETGEEHTLFMDGFEPAVFEEREDGYPVIEQRRNTLRADAILAALASTDMAGAEDEWGKRLDWDGNAQVAQDAYDTLTAPPVEGLTSGEEVRSCPACSGDCGSANPPVIFCPMRDAAPDAPTREKKASDKEGGDDGNVDARNGDRAGVCQPDAVADGHGQPRSVATQRVGLTSGEGINAESWMALSMLAPWLRHNGWHVSADAVDAALTALAASPKATATASVREDEAYEQLRHKLWMIACHATGGGIPEIEGIDRSVNDISVQITASRNLVYQAGKEAGRKEALATLTDSGTAATIGGERA